MIEMETKEMTIEEGSDWVSQSLTEEDIASADTHRLASSVRGHDGNWGPQSSPRKGRLMRLRQEIVEMDGGPARRARTKGERWRRSWMQMVICMI